MKLMLEMNKIKLQSGAVFFLTLLSISFGGYAQKTTVASKAISPDLFGVFFEDLSYAADGGLYAELIQNRSFEYSPSDVDAWSKKRPNWNAFTAWEYITPGYAYGKVELESNSPIHVNNPRYAVITIDDVGTGGVGLSNFGFDGIVVKAGEKYNFSVFAKRLSEKSIPLNISLQSRKGEVYGEVSISADSKEWKRYTATLTANRGDDSATLVVLAKDRGKLALDVVSLFPEKTYKNRANGLRSDLAQAIADLHPKFMRFPGGCLVHGDGLGNMYRWKNTIGPVEQRIEQRNIWNYHQSVGLGYFEYFQFCEDIGAKPLPVVAAGVSCQNSGGTWRIGTSGQKGLPMDEMKEYVQEVLDLIEYANGPVTSKWGAKRAAAGHSKPFNLQYIGIGNEDKQTDAFRERFKVIYNAVKAAHPEITIIGTVGPAPKGEDYEQGWMFANQLNIPIVDEHFYEQPEWFLSNNKRYDAYDRRKSQVYIGEYASRKNALFNAICEAAFMTALERNGDVVRMASYAPLLASQAHTSWSPNLIYFTNKAVVPTVNYYVQQLFSSNAGDTYYGKVISFERKDTLMAASCVKENKTGDIILKIVNAGAVKAGAQVDLAGFGGVRPRAVLTVLTGKKDAKNTVQTPINILPETSGMTVSRSFSYIAPPYSLSVIRIKAAIRKG